LPTPKKSNTKKSSKSRARAKVRKEVAPAVLSMGILDRMGTMEVLPTEGDFICQLKCRHIRKLVQFTPAEIEAWKIRTEVSSNGLERSVKWDETKEKILDFRLTSGQLDLLFESFEKLDKDGKLSQNTIGACEMVYTLYGKTPDEKEETPPEEEIPPEEEE